MVSNVVMKSGGTNATLALTATLTGTNNGNGISILGFTDVGGTIQLSGSHPYTGAISESGVRNSWLTLATNSSRVRSNRLTRVRS